MQCNFNEFFSIGAYLKSMLGIQSNVVGLRMMQVESVGDYFDCTRDIPVDGPEALFRLLVDTNVCNYPVIRVDITTDLGDCENYLGCSNAEEEWFTDLKAAIGKGADGAPVLRILLASGLS